MARRNKNSYRIDADYTEDLVGFALESFLAIVSFPRRHFSLEPFSRAKERWLGADARLISDIRNFRPFYMQFKRPAAYPDFSSSKIIKDRNTLKLQTAPRSLYFSLRKKSDHHKDFQHNVLLRLHQRLRSRSLGDAAYVCPLFLDRIAYRFHLHWSGLSLWPHFWRRNPWDFEELLLNSSGNTIRFDWVSVLSEHITIPPHEKVDSAKHSYSFTEAGKDLCFHSPASLPEGASTLAQYLIAVSDGFLDGGDSINLETANRELESLIQATDAGQPSESSEPFEMVRDDPIGNWLAWGDYLRTEYDIDQYALVMWRD